MSPLYKLQHAGQSIWLDNMRGIERRLDADLDPRVASSWNTLLACIERERATLKKMRSSQGGRQ